jgi:hypothetical protein
LTLTCSLLDSGKTIEVTLGTATGSGHPVVPTSVVVKATECTMYPLGE